MTRDIETKNNVTIARGEWGGDTGEREVGLAGVGWRDGEKMQTIVTE